MRFGLIAALAFAGFSTAGAHAQEWCGYTAKPGSIVQCGYSSVEGCQNTIGRGAMCFVNPFVAMNKPRVHFVALATRPCGRSRKQTPPSADRGMGMDIAAHGSPL